MHTLHANCPKWRQVIDSKLRQIIDDPSLEAKLRKCVELIKTKERHFEMGQSVDELVSHVWPALVVMSGIDSGLKVGSRVSVSTRSGYILGSISSNKCQSVKVAWEDDNSISIIMTASLNDISPKSNLKLSKKMLQPKIVSLLYRLATEMSLLQSSVNWLKLLKTEPSETNHPPAQSSELLDNLFSTKDRRSSRYSNSSLK